MRTLFAFTLALTLTAGGPALPADEPHQHDHGEKLGTVDFPVSCAPSAQPRFQRAVALLHSFAYAEADKAFGEVLAADPACAMGHWGIAMTLFHPIWAAGNPTAAPGPAELQRGAEEARLAKAASPGTDRERDYVAAVAAFYADAPDYATRADAFARGMEAVYTRNPKDREAAIFYALALLGIPSPTDRTYAVQKRAAEILNRVLPEAPDHPGVAHYLIHSFDYPALAELALPAARAYAKIAPSAPHALHMPSHIFVRLGLWEESIGANRTSADTARRLVARTHPGASSFDELHALDYLEYAYLQTGRDAEAAKVLAEIRAVRSLDVSNFAAAYALSAVPARHALERRAWAEAAGLTVQPDWFPWARFPYAEANLQFARALGGARGGRLDVAREALARLDALHDGLAATKDAYWTGQVDIQRRAARAWLARAEGRNEDALREARDAADREDATDKHPVTPGAVLPARELLADLLLESGDARAALVEYEKSLGPVPGRYLSLAGAARAADAAGDTARGREHWARLVAQCAKADVARVEVTKARALLARKR
jgi:hypothetical protein